MGIFNEVIDENKEKFDDLGVHLGELGSYSAQKGYTTMIDDGCTMLPQHQSFLLGLADIWDLCRRDTITMILKGIIMMLEK